MSNAEQSALMLIAQALQELKEQNRANITADQLDKLIEKAGASADALREKLIPENKVSPLVSVFAPLGEAHKPKLTRETHFCGHLQRDADLTPEEVLAYNAIERHCSARHNRWRARVVANGTKTALFVECDEMVDREQARDLPPLLSILQELKAHEQADQTALSVAALQAQIAELRGLVGSPSAA